MKHPIRTAVVVATIAVAAAVGVPAAALASEIYPPSGSCTVSPATVAPGGAVAFECMPGTFSAEERVTITVTGANGGSARIGMLRSAVTTATGSAASEEDGSLAAVSITLPSDAVGVYNIAAISATSAGGTAAVAVSSGSDGLSSSGLDGGSLAGVLIGGGVLVLSGGAFAVAAKRRRSRLE